jgi:hypothetical protein
MNDLDFKKMLNDFSKEMNLRAIEEAIIYPIPISVILNEQPVVDKSDE